MKIARYVVTTMVVLALAGCSTTKPATAPPATLYATHVGQSAATIASHVKACTDVKAGDIGKGGPALVSTATCTIEGHTVNFNSWASSEHVASVRNIFVADKLEAFYTAGDGWTATIGDDPTTQMQLTNDAAGLFDSSLNGATPKSEDLDGQKTVSALIKKSLEGQTIHVALSE